MLAILFQGISVRENLLPVHEGTCSKIFTIALLVGAKVEGNLHILMRVVDKKNIVYSHDGIGVAVLEEIITN